MALVSKEETAKEIATLIGKELGNGWGYSANQLKCAEKIFDNYVGTVITDLEHALSLIKEGRDVINQNEKWVELIIKTSYERIKEVGERIKTAFYTEFDELIPSIMADKIDEIIKEYTEPKAE